MYRSPRRFAGVVPTLLAVVAVGCSDGDSLAPTPQPGSAPGPAQLDLSPAFDAFNFGPLVYDDAGPNDTPAQTDLNAFARADDVSGRLGVMWTWDDIDSWSGSGQTGDACALFDTDATPNGNADYAVCVRITNAADGSIIQLAAPASPQIYACSDKKTDRCSQPNPPPLPLGGTFCEVTLGDEGFPGEGDDNADVVAACSIALSAIGATSTTNLLNVCSYPSGAPNSNPFDCVVTPGVGFIQIVKQATPDDSDETFSFTLSPASSSGQTAFSVLDEVGDDETALIPVAPGTYSLTEGALPTGWSLYAAACVRDGDSEGSLSGSTISGIGVTIGETTVCTFDNRIIAPTVSVTKTADPIEIPETGGNVEYTIEVENTSSMAVTLDSILDDKFGDLDGAHGAEGCNAGGTIEPGATYTCSFTEYLAAAPAGSTHTNTVTAWVSNAGGDASDDDDAVVTFANVEPEISVTKTASPGSVPETGGEVTYTVLVENTGDVPVTLTSLVDDIFGNLDGEGDCAIGDAGNPTMIGVGDDYECTFAKTLSDNADEEHINEVTATAEDADESEVTASDTARVTFTDVLPSISVTKTPDPLSLFFLASGTLPNDFVPDRTFLENTDPDGGFTFLSPTCDDGGVNDVPAQVDLNCFDRADNLAGLLGVQWTWDDLNSWGGGGQTGDACALLDTDDDGYANVAVCARISNSGVDVVQMPAAGVADVYLCNDRQPDRCAKQVTQLTNLQKKATTCDISVVPETFGGEDNGDVEAVCSIDLTMAPLDGIDEIELLNVCSFPSGEPNSNPFDCVVRAGSGFIRIAKTVTPSTDDLFGFTMSPLANDNTSKYAVKGGVTSALIPVMPANNFSLTEIHSTDWSLNSVSCTVDGGATGTANIAQKRITGILVKRGQTTTCTFDNVANISGEVEYTIVVTNNSDEAVTLFSLNDDKFGDLDGEGDCTVGGTILGKGTYTCTFSKLLSGAPGDEHTNTVTAVGKDDEGNSDDDEDDATVTFEEGSPPEP